MRYGIATVVATALTAGAATATGDQSSSPVFIAAYAAGCLVAVLLAARRAIVLAMVQPPLILLIAAVASAALTRSPDGVSQLAVDTSAVLIGNFLPMVAVTAATLAIGTVRLRRQQAPSPAAGEQPHPAVADGDISPARPLPRS